MLVILTGYMHTVVHSLAVEIWKRTVRIILSYSIGKNLLNFLN